MYIHSLWVNVLNKYAILGNGMGSGNLYESQVKISAVTGTGHDRPTRHFQNESKNIISGPELTEL